MHSSTRYTLQGRTVGLSLLSLIVPLTVIISRDTASTLLTNSAYLGDERLTLAALLTGIGCAIGALIVNRAAPPSWMRGLSIAIAALGGLIGAFLMWGLIGSCGMQVIWDACRP
jgi:hypothetical protein